MKSVNKTAFIKAVIRMLEIHANPKELVHEDLITEMSFDNFANGHLQILMSRMRNEADPSKMDFPAFLEKVQSLLHHQLAFAIAYGFELGIAYDQELRNQDLEGLILKTEGEK